MIVEVGEARPLMGTIKPAKNGLSEPGDQAAPWFPLGRAR